MIDKKFEQLESSAMKRIIAEDSTMSVILEKQYKSSKVLSREFSGFGFFTNFEIIDKSLKLPDNQNFELGNVQLKLEGLKLGAGFVLFIRNGLIKTLECYTYDEPWPAIINTYTFE